MNYDQSIKLNTSESHISLSLYLWLSIFVCPVNIRNKSLHKLNLRNTEYVNILIRGIILKIHYLKLCSNENKLHFYLVYFDSRLYTYLVVLVNLNIFCSCHKVYREYRYPESAACVGNLAHYQTFYIRKRINTLFVTNFILAIFRKTFPISLSLLCL